MNLVHIDNGMTMTSSEIAQLVGSRHDKVKQSIERLVERGVIVRPPMGDEQNIDAMGWSRATQVYVFSGDKGKRDSIVVVAQLSPEFTARLVDRWQELETQLKPTIPNFSDPAEAAIAWAEQYRATQLALATKAEIGSRREATAMNTASQATKTANKLREQLGQGVKHATLTAVSNATSTTFSGQDWRPLKKWCDDNNGERVKVPCPRYGTVWAYPAQAWLDVYGVSLSNVFE